MILISWFGNITLLLKLNESPNFLIRLIIKHNYSYDLIFVIAYFVVTEIYEKLV